MKEAYFPQEIEKRWQEIWERENVFHDCLDDLWMLESVVG